MTEPVEIDETLKGDRRRYRKRVAVVGVLLTYAVCYLVLSLLGGYVETASGRFRMSYGLHTPDLYRWQPRYGSFGIVLSLNGSRAIDADVLGLVFAPMITIDQKWFHRDLPFRASDGRFLSDARMPTDDELHPKYGR